jgi:hypothetical protein
MHRTICKCPPASYQEGENLCSVGEVRVGEQENPGEVLEKWLHSRSEKAAYVFVPSRDGEPVYHRRIAERVDVIPINEIRL